ncbi:MAG: hypothetical protein IPJ71_00030 [Bdellovibrionales bacterium]|nr:hypothetical protein [Bdellovibrionales bacterium]
MKFLTEPIRGDDPYFFLPPVSADFVNFPIDRAVTVSGFNPVGESGDGYYLLKRIGDTWRTTKGPKENFFAVESDPTWIFSALGAKLAGFLGFRFVDASTILVPNASLFNKRIAILNRKLAKKGFERIPIKWLSKIQKPPVSKSDEVITYAEQYVRSFYFDRSSPFEEAELTHDVAHHSLEILLTESQLKPHLARLEMAIEYSKFLRNFFSNKTRKAYPLLSQPQNREAIIALVFQLLARDKDNLSGLLPVNLLKQLQVSQAEAPPNITYFRIADVHLGSGYGKPFRGSIGFLPAFDYTLNGWFQSFLIYHLIPLLNPYREPAPPGAVDEAGINVLLKYTRRAFGSAIQDLGNNFLNFDEEIRGISKVFLNSMRNGLGSTVLVRYDENLDIIGGIASPEHPITSFRRRIEEMQSVLP